MTTKVIESLVAELGFKVDPSGLDKFKKHITDLNSLFTKLSAIGVAAGAALFSIAKTSANNAENLSKTTNKLNISIAAYQRLANAAEIAGESQDSFNQKLELFLKKYQNIKFNSQGNAQKKILSELGIDEELYNRSQSVSFFFSEEDVKKAKEFNKELRLSFLGIKGIKDEIGTKLYPIFESILKPINNWIIKNREWIGLKIEENIVRITAAVKALIPVIGIGLALAIGKLGLAIKSSLLNPLGLVLAGLTLLAIAIEDIYTYSQGGESFTGDIINSGGIDLDAITKALFDFFTKTIPGYIEKIAKYIVDSVPEVSSLIKDIVSKIGEIFITIANIISDKIYDLISSTLPNALSSLGGKLKNGLSNAADYLTPSFLKSDETQLPNWLNSDIQDKLSSSMQKSSSSMLNSNNKHANVTLNNNVEIKLDDTEAGEFLKGQIYSTFDNAYRVAFDNMVSSKLA